MLRALCLLSEMNTVCLLQYLQTHECLHVCKAHSSAPLNKNSDFHFIMTTSIKTSTEWPSLFSKPKSKRVTELLQKMWFKKSKVMEINKFIKVVVCTKSGGSTCHLERFHITQLRAEVAKNWETKEECALINKYHQCLFPLLEFFRS